MPKQLNATSAHDFCLALNTVRQYLGHNMTEMGDFLGVSEAYISLLESGKRKPSRKFLIRLLSKATQLPETLKEQLILSAGFNPEHFQSQEIAKQEQYSCFQSFAAWILNLVRQGQFNQAQDKIIAGFQQFQKPIEMNMLAGYLALNKGDYENALISVKAAEHLVRVQQDFDGGPLSLSHAEILTNLGVIHFMSGSGLLSEWFQANPQTDATLKQKILNDFCSAENFFKEALSQEPEYLYALDEIARLFFNYAATVDVSQSKPYWEQCIYYFERVLQHPERFKMASQHVWEAGFFLAYAYAKQQQFKTARLQIQILLTYQPEYWLGWYVLACSYSLEAEYTQDTEPLRQGMSALQKAIEIHPAAKSQAACDPDLKLVWNEWIFNETD